ncbi:hypothetical protein [Saccharopolyspora cebuensis]|uniref:hypothetical protein n=1 Tax=Saccharopolyspora cebuensis TaxID=418759 RepID=UPI0031E85F0F
MTTAFRTSLALLLVLTALCGLGATAAAQPAPPAPAPAPSPAPETPPPPEPPTRPPPEPDGECGFTNIPACVSEAIEGFFTDLVTPGLNEVLGLLGESLLVTPKLDEVPVIGEIWEQSRQAVLVSYATIVLIAGLLVMAYQTMQTRSSIKEILPRILVGFLAANLSLLVAGHAIDIANALSRSILGSNLDPEQAGQAMADTLTHDLDGGSLFLLFVALALLVMIVVVLVTYVVRVMLTIILLVAAPLLLMCHALPHTEGIAVWWWKAFAGTLLIQIGQSFALVTAMKLFFLPGGITLF